MDNWLIKIASKQKTSSQLLEESLRDLDIDELKKIAGDFSEACDSGGKSPSPKTDNLDKMKNNITAVEEMGRELAHRNGDTLLKHANVLATLKPMAGKALSLAAKHPTATMAGLGAAGGAIAGGPDNRFGGALVGAGLGAGASKLPMGAGKSATTVGANLANKAQGLASKMTPGPFAQGGSVRNAASDIGSRLRGAFGGGSTKLAFPDGSDSWIKQFEGSPLLQQAVALEKESIQSEMEDMQRNAESSRASNEQWQRRDVLNLKKRLLSLTLAEQQINGGDSQGQVMGDSPEIAGAEQSIPPAGSPTPEQPQGEGQIKMAMRRIVARAL